MMIVYLCVLEGDVVVISVIKSVCRHIEELVGRREKNQQSWEETRPVSAKRYRTYLTDAILKGADLGAATLQGANLLGVNLQGAILRDAELQETSMSEANLQEADLLGADLFRADLWNANLQGANLRYANLQEAILWGVNLLGASGVTVDQLRQAKTLEGAILPDGTQLPKRDIDEPNPDWHAAFEEWAEIVKVGEHGHIIPACV
jgi:hypothetical protein